LILVRLAGPECILIELEVFIRNVAEEHAPKPAITDRQGFDPFFSWTGISKNKRLIGADSQTGKEEAEKAGEADS
jgi:hypothetical protein